MKKIKILVGRVSDRDTATISICFPTFTIILERDEHEFVVFLETSTEDLGKFVEAGVLSIRGQVLDSDGS